MLLKARPTRAQLDDRLAVSSLEGLELYLDVDDISGDDWRRTILSSIGRYSVPGDFVWIVEGPLRSLDGEFFNIGRVSEADREVVGRVTTIGAALGARAAVIHCIAPTRDALSLEGAAREKAMACALDFLRYYAATCHESGLVPCIENVPPIARMREGAQMHSSIGMEPADLVYFADNVDGLRLTLDVSHAQLYLNGANGRLASTEGMEQMAQTLQARRAASDLGEFIALLGDRIFEVHVSNAEGIWGEGLPYGQGELALDSVMARLLPLARYIVTETIEPDADNAALMREARERILAVRARLACPT